MHALQDREAQATRLVKLESEQAQLEREYERFQTKERLLQEVRLGRLGGWARGRSSGAGSWVVGYAGCAVSHACMHACMHA